MTRGRIVPVLALLVCVLGTTRAAPASACSCVQVSPELALREHAAVFEGRVRSVESGPDGLTVTLEVVQQWKGIETEQAVVHTATNSAACGVAFEQDTSWLVYADRNGDRLQTGLCSRTRRIEQASDDVAVLGAGVVPVEIGPDDEVEPPASPPPAQAGCASCTVGASHSDRAVYWGLLPVAALWLRRSLKPR